MSTIFFFKKKLLFYKKEKNKTSYVHFSFFYFNFYSPLSAFDEGPFISLIKDEMLITRV